MPASAHDGLRLRLVAPAESPLALTIPLVLRVENTGDRPLDLYLRGRAVAFDVVVTSANGDVVWRRLEGEVVPAILQLRTLAPREVLELHAEWAQRSNAGRQVPEGLYAARGLLLTDGETPLESPAVRVRLLPG